MYNIIHAEFLPFRSRWSYPGDIQEDMDVVKFFGRATCTELLLSRNHHMLEYMLQPARDKQTNDK
jgi:hypothetical protein